MIGPTNHKIYQSKVQPITIVFSIPTVNNDYYIVRFMIYPDLTLVMNSIRILNNKEISLN